MYCSKCGHDNPDGSRFCSGCGEQMSGTRKTQSVPPDPPSGGGGRRASDKSDVVYPRNPPHSPHWCWLNLLLAGLAQIVHGQVAKGVVVLGIQIASNLLLPVILALAIGAASIIDAYMVGKRLQEGTPVGKWEFFPTA